jgi:DNA-binding SARP family transcriptional activator
MSNLRFQLFGKFTVQRDALLVKGLDASKEQELLCYLLVVRDRCHAREMLASLLWGDVSTGKSKKYLRQALWHVQTVLEAGNVAPQQILLVGHDWVQLNSQSDVWLDLALFEQAFAAASGVAGKDIDKPMADMLKDAISLYRGDLLEGWYQDWCLFERERVQNMYLSMLDKLVAYSEEHSEYEAGQGYGAVILRYDRAREHTHRQLMHLQYRAGDRTGALRQYERCVRALDEELGVKPQRHTTSLYEQIRADQVNDVELAAVSPASLPSTSLPEVLGRLKGLQSVLAALQKRVQQDIKAVEQGLKAIRH